MSTMQESQIKSKRVELILQQLSSLPTLPAVAARLLQITVKSTTQADEVIKLIESDPSLSSKIIALSTQASKDVNRKQVSSVSKAVVLLGFESVRNAVLSIKVFETLNKTDSDETEFDRNEFWKHCLAVACATKKFIKLIDAKADPEEAFLCGLLHDLGKVALDSCLPKSVSRVVQITESTLENIADVENKILGIDHTRAGKRLAQKWQLPESIIETIWLHHHHPDALPEGIQYPSIIKAVYLADLLVREQRIGYSGNHSFHESAIAVGQELGIDQADIEQVARELRQEVSDRAFILGLDDLEPEELYQEALTEANTELSVYNHKLQVQNKKLQIRSSYFELLSQLGSRLQPLQTVAEVCDIISELWQSRSDVLHCGTFVHVQESGIIEGAARIENQSEPIIFLIEQFDDELNSGVSVSENDDVTFEVELVGQKHEWFFEQVSISFDKSRTYYMPLRIGDQDLGGLLWECRNEQINYVHQLKEMQAFCSSASMAIKQSQRHEALTSLCEQLAQSNRLLHDARQEVVQKSNMATLGEMAGGAAHEINNPLAIIVGRSELMASSEQDPEKKKSLESIAREGNEITKIITSLMEFAKPKQPQPHSVDLESIFNQAIQACEPIAKKQNITFERSVEKDLPEVFVDEDQIVQAFKEIVLNAIAAYEGKGGHIVLKAYMNEHIDEIVAEVVDDGIGMDSVTLENAFTPFYSSKQAGRNRGLGLSRSVRHVEKNNGRLRLISEIGKGTSARIVLPISQLASVDHIIS